MSRTLIIILSVLGVLALIAIIAVMSFISKYNQLVALNEGVSEKWGQVENVYQRRADLIPNLVNTVKGYMVHERETLESVVEARAKATQTNLNVSDLQNPAAINEFAQNQQALSGALSRLMVVVERYPDLKANQNFLALQSQLEGTENRIAVERRRYNEAVRNYNTLIRQFPSNLIAGMFNFGSFAYFEADAGADQAPVVSFD